MTRKDKLLLLAIVGVLALVVAHAFLSVDVVRGGRKVISRVELKNLDPANNGINIEVRQPWFNPRKELAFNVGEPDNAISTALTSPAACCSVPRNWASTTLTASSCATRATACTTSIRRISSDSASSTRPARRSTP